MIESFKEIIHLFTDKSKSWGYKTAVFISIIGVVFLVDFCFNVSYNITLNNKISQLEKIQKLKIGYSNDTLKLKKIEQIENQVINKVHYTDYIKENLFESPNIKIVPKTVASSTKNQIKKASITKPSFSLFWMVITSNFLLIIILPFLIFMPLFPSTKITSEVLLGWFASLVFISGIICFITWISYQIPLVLNNPNYNYILNFIIHMAFMILIARMNKNKQN